MKKTLCTASAVLLASTALASAGGLDRRTFSVSPAFETGNYVDISFAQSDPAITSNNDAATGGLVLNDSWDVANDVHFTSMNFKTDITEKFSLAVGYNDNTAGVNIDYAPYAASAATPVQNLSSLNADLKISALTAVGKYKISDRFSVLAGIKNQTVEGSANVTVPLGAAAAAAGAGAAAAAAAGDATTAAELSALATSYGTLALTGAGATTLNSDSATNFIIGAAYEIPEYALRVVATYESDAETNPGVVSTAGAATTGPGSIKTPEVFKLEFQSGISEKYKLLVFGEIRHAKWADAQTTMSDAYNNLQLSDFDDSTSYTIGLGKQFSDNLAGFVSFYTEPSDCTDASLLSPTCDNQAITIGAEYTLDSGLAIAASATQTTYGDAVFWGSDGAAGGGDDIVFGGNKTTTLGLRLSYNF